MALWTDCITASDRDISLTSCCANDAAAAADYAAAVDDAAVVVDVDDDVLLFSEKEKRNLIDADRFMALFSPPCVAPSLCLNG